MRNVFSLIAAAGFVLAVPAESGAATLARAEAKDAPSSAHGLSETNAQLVVSLAGLSLLPEKDAGAANAGGIHPGAESFAGHGGADGELMLAFLRSLHRANARGSFAADTTTTTETGSTGGDAAGQLGASGEALDAIRAMQQSGVVAVPEPSTYALVGAGAVLLAFKARRRRLISQWGRPRYSSR